jgi:molybdopterin/thiamine biosynthesis adenylyltransferase
MTSDRSSRQSFLRSVATRRRRIDIIGLGGGSHLAQQCAHIGFQRYAMYNADVLEDSNLNRTVGATEPDVAARTKVAVARRPPARGRAGRTTLLPGEPGRRRSR